MPPLPTFTSLPELYVTPSTFRHSQYFSSLPVLYATPSTFRHSQYFSAHATWTHHASQAHLLPILFRLDSTQPNILS
jgi:hypothetical protein